MSISLGVCLHVVLRDLWELTWCSVSTGCRKGCDPEAVPVIGAIHRWERQTQAWFVLCLGLKI